MAYRKPPRPDFVGHLFARSEFSLLEESYLLASEPTEGKQVLTAVLQWLLRGSKSFHKPVRNSSRKHTWNTLHHTLHHTTPHYTTLRYARLQYTALLRDMAWHE